jgi:PAS domain S-box-containing protein
MILVGGVLFSLVGARAWWIVAEERRRRLAEEELRASEQRYRHLFEKNPAPMLIYERGSLELLAVNEAFLRSYGYAEEEALRLHLTDLYPPEERQRIVDVAAGLRGHAFVGEWHHVKKDRSVITVVATSHDLTHRGRQARIAVVTDISDRKRAENALRDSEQKFMKAFHATPDAIVLSRADGRLLDVNDVFLRVTGHPREIALGGSALDLGLWADPEDARRYVEAVRAQGRVRELPARFRTRAGAVLDGLVSGEPIVLGEERCLLTIIRDVTERNRTEQELERHRLHLEEMVEARTEELARSEDALRRSLAEVTAAKQDLEAANARLRELDRLKSLFIASMSHELRTPLNSIIGFTGILLQGLAGPLNPEQRKQLSIVKSSSEHLLSLITDVIDLSKIEAGKIDLASEAFDLSALVREVLGSFQVTADRKALSLAAEVPDRVTVVSDRRRVRQVLVNLVGNAMKFTERGGVRVAAKARDGVVEVRVRDTGIGIRRQDLGRLFKSFSQVTTPEVPKHEGTGLGLYLSKRLVTLLGGEIGVESEQGEGSEFFFSLPARREGEP